MARRKTSTATGSDGTLAGLEVEIRDLRLADLARLDANARYMAKGEFDRLVENLKRDGRLTSVPLVCPAGDHPLTERGAKEPDVLEILSGNHRVEAAIAAGIETAKCMVVATPIDRQRKIAIQLAHNSIVGQDDPNVLAELYKGLDFDWKEYSGLTDDVFVVGDLDAPGLGLGGPGYEEIVLTFLPEDAAVLRGLLEKIGKSDRRPMRLAAPIEAFSAMFDAIVATKEGLNIHNSATALLRMAELAAERLDQLAAESGEDDA